jgi:hypothetical protein
MATTIRISAPTAMSKETTDGRLARQTVARPAKTSRHLPGIARLAMVLETLLGIGALFGGGQFILAPDGHLLGLPLKMLAGTPFNSFLVPGLLLFTCVGVAPIAAAAITARRPAIVPLAALAVGVTLMGWITVEMVIFAGLTSLLWAFYMVLGTVIAAVGVAWWRSDSARGNRPV